MAKEERVKPLDEFFSEMIEEFDSGVEKERDSYLDSMLWELGDQESHKPPEAAAKFPAEESVADLYFRKTLNSLHRNVTSHGRIGSAKIRVRTGGHELDT